MARSGEEALEKLKKHRFALILSDLKMPDMDGRRMFNHIADHHPAEVERLAFLTGDTISPDAQVFLRATNRPYLEKPIKPNELRSFVHQWVRRQPPTRAIFDPAHRLETSKGLFLDRFRWSKSLCAEGMIRSGIDIDRRPSETGHAEG